MNESASRTDVRSPQADADRSARADRGDEKIRAYLKACERTAKARAKERIRDHLRTEPGATREQVVDAVARAGWTQALAGAAYDDLMAAIRIGREPPNR